MAFEKWPWKAEPPTKPAKKEGGYEMSPAGPLPTEREVREEKERREQDPNRWREQK